MSKTAVSLLCMTFAALLCSAAAARGQSADIHIGYLFSDGQMPVTVASYRQLQQEQPELASRTRLTILTESTFDEVVAEDLLSVDVLVYDVMNEQMMARFDATHDANLIDQIRQRGGVVVGVGQGLMLPEQYSERGVTWHDTPRAFWAASGLANHVGLLKFALRQTGVGITVPTPAPTLAEGFYYPSEDGGQVFPDWEAFDTWRQQTQNLPADVPRIAIGFYRANFYGNEMAIVDALVAEIEAQGAQAIPYFGYPGHTATAKLLLDGQGQRRADVVLAFLFRFAQPDSSALLREVDIPIINLVTLYGRSEAEWRASDSGLSLFEGTFQVAAPELAGLIAPTVVGSRERVQDAASGLSVILQTPIQPRVQRAVARAIKLAQLRDKPSHKKKLALLFYNYPAGKAAIGASYLNVPASLAHILNHLQAAGYDLGDREEPFAEETLLAELTQHALNIAGYAPGELADRLQADHLVRIPLPTYQAWLEQMNPQLVNKINADWGAAADTQLMAEGGTPGALVVPAITYGNVTLLPQPIRGWGEDDEQLYHADDLAPHHQYTAAYLWLRNSLQADAVLHLGTHGTLEWLDGKDTGLSDADAPEALIADLPHIYPYNVDVVGEGLIARRRGAATLIDHMVPPFVQGGQYAQLAELSERINSYHTNLGKNPQLAREYGNDVIKLVNKLGIDKDLGLDLLPTDGSTVALPTDHTHAGGHNHHHQDRRDSTVVLDHDVIHTILDYLQDLKEQNIPYGLHAFGRLPTEDQRASTVAAIVSGDPDASRAQQQALAASMNQAIVDSAELELERLLTALQGGYVPGGTGGEPIRNPDAYPTGKNFFGIDPDKVPSKAAWRIGGQLAEEFLQEHQRKHGEWPQKVSFVIWGDETMRHEGILESQIFHLLGTRPVWDARDKVVDVEVIPRDELNRPRVDIVIASAAEGMFYNVTMLMDKAVQLVKTLDEPDNFVRKHFLAAKAELMAFGYGAEQAELRAAVRIFDEAPGTYNLNVSRIAEASGTWDSDISLAHDYTKKMGHGFGNGFWGEPMEDVFRIALSGSSSVVHSSSTMLYGGLDNDDFYMYMGGLANAIKSIDGTQPAMVVTNTRNPARPDMTGIDEFLGSEMRTRYFNPTWIEGMQGEGYAGAGEMRQFVEYLWGWDATASSTVDDRMWNDVYEVYVLDRHNMDMQAYFDEASPHAYQDMTMRMLETTRKGYWEAPAEVRQHLAQEYLDSVQRNGIACSEITCGNPRLLQYLMQQARDAGVTEEMLAHFQQEIERRMGGAIDTLAAEQAAFAKQNEERIRRRQAMLEDGMTPAEIEQYELDMQQLDAAATQSIKTEVDQTAASLDSAQSRVPWPYFVVGAVVVALLMVLVLRRRSRPAVTAP